jgi:hypothetical protein
MKERKVIDAVELPPTDKDRDIEYVETSRGRIDLTPAIKVGIGDTVRIELFDNGTVDAWLKIATGEKGEVQ